MYRPKFEYKLLIGICLIIGLCQLKLQAQIVIGQPNLGFSQACANDTFNTFSASFIFSPEANVNPSNQFIVELSNADGDFTDPIILFASDPGSITVSPGNVNFSLPEDTAGENYRIRIRSTAPVASSTPSVPFAAYFKIQDSPFTINNLVETAAFCAGGSYLLTIDNPGNNNNDSPLNYPSLTFYWYRETGPTTSEFVAEGPILEVSTEGTFFVETNYGSCTSDSFSNRVTITEVNSGEAEAGISSSLGNPYCPEQGLTTLSTLGGLSYQWFKDGVLIPDATSQMYQTNESGTFSVQVDLGDCSASGAIVLESELFEGSINVDEVNMIEEGTSLDVIVTTNANAPVYEWYFNNILIDAATDDNYTVSEYGDYKIIVSETLGCQGSRTFAFELREAIEQFPDVPNIPNVVSPNGDGINDTWQIPLIYASGSNANVKIMSNRGEILVNTNDYQNNWPAGNLNLTAINQVYYYIITTTTFETRKGSITIIR